MAITSYIYQIYLSFVASKVVTRVYNTSISNEHNLKDKFYIGNEVGHSYVLCLYFVSVVNYCNKYQTRVSKYKYLHYIIRDAVINMCLNTIYSLQLHGVSNRTDFIRAGYTKNATSSVILGVLNQHILQPGRKVV